MGRGKEKKGKQKEKRGKERKRNINLWNLVVASEAACGSLVTVSEGRPLVLRLQGRLAIAHKATDSSRAASEAPQLRGRAFGHPRARGTRDH